jgi:hypothetical protein
MKGTDEKERENLVNIRDKNEIGSVDSTTDRTLT